MFFLNTLEEPRLCSYFGLRGQYSHFYCESRTYPSIKYRIDEKELELFSYEVEI